MIESKLSICGLWPHHIKNYKLQGGLLASMGRMMSLFTASLDVCYYNIWTKAVNWHSNADEIIILRPSTGEDYFSYNALHIVTSPAFTSEISLPISFSFRPDTVLYTLAYGLSDGRIKVWSIQSNMFFKDGGPGVELIAVHDRKGRDRDSRVSEGKCFTIMPPREYEDIRQEIE